MPDARQISYIPNRLRRPRTGRKDLRIRFHQTKDVVGGAAQHIVENSFGKGLFFDDFINEMGTQDQTLASGATIGTTELPNANRAQNITFRAFSINWTAASSGSILSMGNASNSNGFDVWLETDGRLHAGVRHGSFESRAFLQLEVPGSLDGLVCVIEVNPLSIALGFDQQSVGDIQFGFTEPGEGGTRFCDDGNVGGFLTANPNAPFAPGTAPLNGLSGGNVELWYNQSFFDT